MNLALSETELPVRLRFERPMTDEELLRFCNQNEPLRVERDANGELIVMSPTWSETSSKNSDLTYQLEKWVRETNSGKPFDSNGGFTLPDTSMRAADAAWISWARWNALTDEQRHGYAKICPQFVVELRSETDRLSDVQEKMGQWIANGAELGWLIDPLRKLVEIYRPGRQVEVLEGGSCVEGDGPVGGFVLELARIWS
jgi:Uma2 family endonuclease